MPFFTINNFLKCGKNSLYKASTKIITAHDKPKLYDLIKSISQAHCTGLTFEIDTHLVIFFTYEFYLPH